MASYLPSGSGKLCTATYRTNTADEPISVPHNFQQSKPAHPEYPGAAKESACGPRTP